MKHLFIINPAAGKKNTTAQLERLLSDLSFDHQVVYTLEAGDARRITEEAAATGEPIRIYACGGDGTLNEVVNGAAGHDHVAITCVPKGTGNDFLKVFGPDYRTLFYDLEALAQGPQSSFDLMDCNGQLGIDVVCCGVDARIAAGVHRYKDRPLVSGIGAYILSLLENVLFKPIFQPLKVLINGETWDRDTTLLCVCNARHYGGGFMPVGDNLPDDGVLEVLIVPKVSRFTFFRLVKHYASGRYADYPELVRFHQTQSLDFSSRSPLTVVVDGEVLTGHDFTLRLSEKKVSFFYPEGASYQPVLPVKPRADISTPASRL